MKKLYCFDFDGTLTYKDSMLLFLKFCSPLKYRIQFVRHMPLFVLMKLKLMKPEHVKKSLIASILKGKTQEELAKSAGAFFEKYFPSLMRENALAFVGSIDHSKTECLLVTASLDIWTRPFADHLKMKLVATKAEFKNGIFTGEFATANCNGQEKVQRIKEALGNTRFDKTIAFGDTAYDRPMLSWADEGHYRFFH